jgi:putative membrane-bound dehydrogenase-like protein
MKKLLSTFAVLVFSSAFLFSADKKIVLVAGKPSHGAGAHEHNAGSLLLKKCLDGVKGVKAEVQLNGWPEDESIFDGADAIVLYMDGGANHPILQGDRLQKMNERVKKGVGFACVHYAVEPTIEKGEKEFLDWIGGAFEIDWSVNPHWEANFTTLPKHPITSGVQPFKINDEWYFHMRFKDGLKGITPILSAIPPESTMERADGHHSGNPHVRAAVKRGDLQHVAWAYERPDSGRGFGFTGAHFHNSWGNENFRKLVLNAILWIAKADVPKNGVDCAVTEEDLQKNLDPKGEKKKINSPTPKAASSKGAAANSPSSGESSVSKPKFKSGVMNSSRAPADIDISGAKKLWLIVTDGGDGYSCDWANWIEPKLVRADGSAIFLTALDWKSATTGFGQVNKHKNCMGGPLKMEKREMKIGIGTHAPSIIEFDLPEAFERFQARVAPDMGGVEQGCGTSIEFLVYTEPPPANVLDLSLPTEPKIGIEAAKDSLSSMTVADGLEVSVYAAEPLLRNPTNIDIDDRGRVWVTEAINYRSSFQSWGILDPAGDRIVILEDTNGDGVADSSKVFYQDAKMRAPLGICVLGKKVIVSASPEVFILTDTDGDDKADKKQILFTVEGFDNDHGVHAMIFGPDGKLYFNYGNVGTELKTPDGKPLVDIDGNVVSTKTGPYRQGMAFRCNLDGSEVEVLGHNFRNPYELAVDSFGTVWQSDNDDDGNRSVRINYMMQHGNYGYADEITGASWPQQRTNWEEEIYRRHWHQNDPGVVPNMLITGAGSPTGIIVYEGKLLPQVFRNQLIHCDAGPRIVRSYVVTNDGAGYKAEIVDILTSIESWFRPSDVCVAPDGSLLIADWNDAGVGGHNMVDRDVQKMKGRIFRVAPKGHKPSIPHYDFTLLEGSIAALQSPNMATRYRAWDELHALGNKAEKELRKLWEGDYAQMRARALQLLARIEGKAEKYIGEAIRDDNSDIRIAGLRIARDLKLDAIHYIKKLVDDDSAHVRRECALTLRGIDSPQSAKLWVELAEQYDGKDRWYLEALGLAADKNEDLFFQAWLKEIGDKWNTPAGRDIIWRLRSPDTAAYLAKIIADPATPATERAKYFRAFDFLKGPEKQEALIELLSTATK